MAATETSTTYTVEGAWPFPTDMLRHDGSCAATAEDQIKIDRLSGASAPDLDSLRVKTSITLTLTTIGRRCPNTARWESFGWTIPGDLEHAFAKRWEAEEEQKRALRESGLAKLTPAERRALDIRDAARTHSH